MTCKVPSCTGTAAIPLPVCKDHAAKIPPYWVKRYRAAVKDEAEITGKHVPARQRLAAVKEVEFTKDACIGAAMKQ